MSRSGNAPASGLSAQVLQEGFHWAADLLFRGRGPSLSDLSEYSPVAHQPRCSGPEPARERAVRRLTLLAKTGDVTVPRSPSRYECVGHYAGLGGQRIVKRQLSGKVVGS